MENELKQGRRVRGVLMPPTEQQIEKHVFDRDPKYWAVYIFMKYWPGEEKRMEGLIDDQEIKAAIWEQVKISRKPKP